MMIKGLEALVIESYTTARKYGVEDHVLPTLAETFPSIDWQQTGAYFFSRVVQHGKRRAEEMRESANTVKEAGFEPMARLCRSFDCPFKTQARLKLRVCAAISVDIYLLYI